MNLKHVIWKTCWRKSLKYLHISNCQNSQPEWVKLNRFVDVWGVSGDRECCSRSGRRHQNEAPLSFEWFITSNHTVEILSFLSCLCQTENIQSKPEKALSVIWLQRRVLRKRQCYISQTSQNRSSRLRIILRSWISWH